MLSVGLKSSVPPQKKWPDLTCPRGSASRLKLPWRFFFSSPSQGRHVHDSPGATTPTHQTPPTPHSPNPKPTATGSQWEQDIRVHNEIRQLKLTGELGGHAPFSGCWSRIKLHTHPSPAYQPSGFLAEGIRAFAGWGKVSIFGIFFFALQEGCYIRKKDKKKEKERKALRNVVHLKWVSFVPLETSCATATCVGLVGCRGKLMTDKQ